MPSTKAEMDCDICGRPGARVRRTARSYGEKGTLWVIEGVPVVSCPHCGESYLRRKLRDGSHCSNKVDGAASPDAVCRWPNFHSAACFERGWRACMF